MNDTDSMTTPPDALDARTLALSDLIDRGNRARAAVLYLALEAVLDDRDGILTDDQAHAFSRAYDAAAGLLRQAPRP